MDFAIDTYKPRRTVMTEYRLTNDSTVCLLLPQQDPTKMLISLSASRQPCKSCKARPQSKATNSKFLRTLSMGLGGNGDDLSASEQSRYHQSKSHKQSYAGLWENPKQWTE
nr:hypothetical protein CFP56_30085 [Quercus suber]